jgi:hypothetical protein
MIAFGKRNRRPEPDRATAVRPSICKLRLWASLLLNWFSYETRSFS